MILRYSDWRKLFEDESTEKYTVLNNYDFSGVFPSNMVTPTPQSYKPTVDRLIADVKGLIDKGYKISELIVKVESSSSATPATKCLPKGFDKPDHDFGGAAPDKKWIQVEPGQCPTSQRVEGGNQFLANTRGNNLITAIKKELATAGIDEKGLTFDFKGGVVSASTDPKEQFVKAQVLTKLTKDDEKKYKFLIEAYAIKVGTNSETSYCTQASLGSLFGEKKFNQDGSFTLQKAQSAVDEISKKIGRTMIVKEDDTVDTKSKYFEYYGKIKVYFPIESVVKIEADTNISGAYKFWYESYDSWKKEVDFIAKNKGMKPSLTENVSKTAASASFVGRAASQIS